MPYRKVVEVAPELNLDLIGGPNDVQYLSIYYSKKYLAYLVLYLHVVLPKYLPTVLHTSSP